MTHRRYFHIRKENIRGKYGFIEPGEARHIRSVCRMEKGDTVHLLDGVGGVYRAELLEFSPSGGRVLLQESVTRKKGFSPDMAIALIKAGRMDAAVEKCAEIGTGSIIPFACARTVWRGGGGSAGKKRERLRRKVIAACKQSGNPFFPEVEPVIDMNGLLKKLSGYDQVYLADRRGRRVSAAGKGRVIGVVGPEGGLSADEVEKLVSAGGIPVSLGENRLRAETAAACLLFCLKAAGGSG
ncbi:MAG: RsmE family RNA methyltransferase [Candidatus Latescibacteria bacterium]|nr:RsmE family RNA methyltransferase [bacterium]MBD3424525.1 RsmE family RNA methyltransferase [Candidatus Latescibacterota bacterium]